MSSDTSFFGELDNSNKFFLNFDLKMCAIILFIIVIICIYSSFSSIFNIENFSNDKFYSYKNILYSNYASIPLTALNLDNTENIPGNVLFGQATRIISADVDWMKSNKRENIYKLSNGNIGNIEKGPIYYHLEILANLYILNGNIFDDITQKIINQTYVVNLYNPKMKNSIILGNLYKDNDGMYKLKYKIDIEKVPSSVGNIIDYTIIQIIYYAIDSNNKILENKIIIQGDLTQIP